MDRHSPSVYFWQIQENRGKRCLLILETGFLPDWTWLICDACTDIPASPLEA